jgi:hypothetical protein
MITEAILSIFHAVASGVLFLFPALSIGSDVLGSVSGLIELLAYASIFVPFSAVFICLSAWVAFHVFQLGMSIANWIIGKIPTIS